jgi:hypothetical protein
MIGNTEGKWSFVSNLLLIIMIFAIVQVIGDIAVVITTAVVSWPILVELLLDDIADYTV